MLSVAAHGPTKALCITQLISRAKAEGAPLNALVRCLACS